MRVLLDTGVWGGALGEIRAAGHDVVWEDVKEFIPNYGFQILNECKPDCFLH